MTTALKTMTYLKINWTQNNSDDGGAMKKVNDELLENQTTALIIQKKNGRAWAGLSKEDLLRISSKDIGLYEVITKYPHKVYFDIDADNKDYNIYDKIIPKINELFPDADMAISGSVSDVRQSYHIVLNNFTIDNIEDRETIKALVNHLKTTFDDSFDNVVYSKNRNMKCINQSKGDARIQKIILNSDATKHFITTYLQDEVYEMPNFNITHPVVQLAIDIDKCNRNKFNVGELPKMILQMPEGGINLTNFNPEDALRILPINKTFNHSYTHFVARYCAHNDCSFDIFYSWYKNKNDDINAKIKWTTHWENCKFFKPVDRQQIITLLAKFYPKLRQNSSLINFNNNFNITPTKLMSSLDESIFTSDKQDIIINTGMGSGKTYQSVKFLKTQSEFLWITPNIALADNTTQRLRSDGINVAHYKDFKRVCDKQDKIHKQNQLIICLNSIHYIYDRKYKVVVIDEIETFLNKWFNNNTLKENKFELWTRFLDVIRNADKVIYLDAFTSKLTINFINNIRNSTTSYDLIEMNNHNVNRTIKTKSSFESWKRGIIETLKENKKVFIFYPYKNESAGKTKFDSMAMMQTVFERETGKKGIAYNADSEDAILKTLSDVNKNWSEVDFVITNNKINVGLNYELEDFDCVYMAIANFNSPRDIIQVSYRCRNLQSNLINIVYLDSYKPPFVFENDTSQLGGCEIYKNLLKDILIEKYSPLRETFNMFCSKAHYKMDMSKELLNKKLDADIKKMFEDTDMGYSYNSILDVNDDNIERYENKIYTSTSTLEDRMIIKKYYYKRSFAYESRNNIEMEEGWNNKYLFFFNKVKIIKLDNSICSNNIFEKIRLSNNWESIFPTDKQMTDVKLSVDIRKEIFEDKFIFRDCHNKTSDKVLIKNIYNAYFQKSIIKAKEESTRHGLLEVNDNTRRIYKWSYENLIIYRKVVYEIGIDFGLDEGIDEAP